MTKAIRATVAAALLLVPMLGRAAEGGEGGMPQLRFSDPMLIAQVVWLLIIFGLLYFIMATYALPRAAGVLAERRARIDGDLEVARAAKDRADAAMAEHRAATAQARSEAQAAIAAAMAHAQEASAKAAEDLNARLARQIEAAESRIATGRDAAMATLREVSTDTAEALVIRLTGRVDRGLIDAAVGQELFARGRS